MNDDNQIVGYFVSGPTLDYSDSEARQKNLLDEAKLFRSYIWGENGLVKKTNHLNFSNYGDDLRLVLFQFYLKPSLLETESLHELEGYRKKEKSIGFVIAVTDEKFFTKDESKRKQFIMESILQKVATLKELITRKELDTNVDLLQSDLLECLINH
jgi:hypothetical protein